jgi:hypothetical protein
MTTCAKNNGARREQDSPVQDTLAPDPHAGQVLRPWGDRVGIRGGRYILENVELETVVCSKDVGVDQLVGGHKNDE